MEDEIIDFEKPRNSRQKARVEIGMLVSVVFVVLGLIAWRFHVRYSEWSVIIGNAMLVNWYFVKSVHYRQDLKTRLGRMTALGLIVTIISLFVFPIFAYSFDYIKCITLFFLPIYLLGKPE